MTPKTINDMIARKMAGVRQAFRGVLRHNDNSTPNQLAQVEGVDGETLQGVEVLQQFGMSSNPPDGSSVIVLPLGGRTGHAVVIASDNDGLRVRDLAPGETVIYSNEGAYVKIGAGRVVETDCDVYRVNCKTYEVNASDGAGFNTPMVTASEQMTAEGQINGNGGMAVQGGTGTSITGNIRQTGGSYTTDGDVTAGAISLQQHKHTDSIGGDTSPSK